MPEPLSFSTRRTEIAGVSVLSLAEQFGTPLYVYDAEMIRTRLRDLSIFPVVRYAQKACSNLAILRLIRGAGAVVDAVSGMEIERAVAAGWPAAAEPGCVPPIVYTADIFDRYTLDLVTGKYPVHVNCGSIDMIHQYGSRVQNREITLRINPGFGHGHSRKTNTGGPGAKHGIWHEQLDEALAAAARYRLRVTGLHLHIGSGTDMEHLSKVVDAMDALARRVGSAVTSISGGGGLPVPYRPGEEFVDLEVYAALWKKKIDQLSAVFGHPISFEIEPGRYPVAESGYLLCEIRAVKRQGENLFYLVDAGFNNLIRPSMYGSYHPISIVRQAQSSDRGDRDVIVGGPLCESGDIFTQAEGGYVEKRTLPAASVGDYLVLENAGAYGAVMGSNYNTRPMCAEVLIDGGRARLIRARQSFDQIVENEERQGL